jgi:hypothetical protein
LALLLRKNIATLDELTLALVTSVTVTVFRKPKTLDYLTSYSHRGRYYTLREISEFDVPGLCSHAGIHFSRFGTLLATAEALVNRSPRGHSAEEVARPQCRGAGCTASTDRAAPDFSPGHLRKVPLHRRRSRPTAGATWCPALGRSATHAARRGPPGDPGG